IVLVDFDETITTTETTPLLGQSGLDFHKNPLPWSYFIDTYMDDYNRIKAGLPPSLTPEERIHALRPSEEASLARIHKRRVFEGMTRTQIFENAQKLAPRFLRPGALEALSSLSKDRLRIISVNWSKDWIQGMLGPLALSYCQIHCNDLIYDDSGKATGEIEPRMLTSYDKKHQMHLIRQEFSADTPTVYIGDSPGDILPLVEADIGIIIGKNTRLLQALEN
ncbi:HAD-like domain-containing protein, partial [Fennellomyces sp. T-0311]